MNDEMLLRDFIYLDIERVRSFVAQVAGGLTSELGTQDEEKTAKAELKGGLPRAGSFRAPAGSITTTSVRSRRPRAFMTRSFKSFTAPCCMQGA